MDRLENLQISNPAKGMMPYWKMVWGPCSLKWLLSSPTMPICFQKTTTVPLMSLSIIGGFFDNLLANQQETVEIDW